MSLPAVTILKADIVRRHCPHCGAITVQVGRVDPWKGGLVQGVRGHCLQCIADGGTCCSISEFNRHAAYPQRPSR